MTVVPAAGAATALADQTGIAVLASLTRAMCTQRRQKALRAAADDEDTAADAGAAPLLLATIEGLAARGA